MEVSVKFDHHVYVTATTWATLRQFYSNLKCRLQPRFLPFETVCQASCSEISILVWNAPEGIWYTWNCHRLRRKSCKIWGTVWIRRKFCPHVSTGKWTYLSKMHCTSKLSTSHTSMLSSWKPSRWETEVNKQQISNTVHVLHVQSYLWNERDVYSCIRFDKFDKYLSSNVPQELCNNNMVTFGWKRQILLMDGLKPHSPLTLYVLANEGVIHYVAVICFQNFLKFSNVIVLVSTGRKKQTMLKWYTDRDTVAHAERVKHTNIWAPLQTIYYNVGFKDHHRGLNHYKRSSPNALTVLPKLQHKNELTLLKEIKEAYLTKFVIARISGSFL